MAQNDAAYDAQVTTDDATDEGEPVTHVVKKFDEDDELVKIIRCSSEEDAEVVADAIAMVGGYYAEISDDPATEAAVRTLNEQNDEDVSTERVYELVESNTTSGSGDRIIRFVGDREGGVSFHVSRSSLYRGDYYPDEVFAEQIDARDGIRNALERLEEVADLRRVGDHRHGVFTVDEETGRVDGVRFSYPDRWLPEDVDLDALEQELVALANGDA